MMRMMNKKDPCEKKGEFVSGSRMRGEGERKKKIK